MPLFILAAELMNTGTLTERLLHFCNAIVGRFRVAWRSSTSPRASSSPACRARPSPTPPAAAS
ncbi:MAG: hypothetical protein R3C69_04625 [Geminicoccaceae bacterium]